MPPALTDSYVQKMACPIGDTIDYEKFAGATHGTIPSLAFQTVLRFFATWVSGGAAPVPASTCGQPGDSHLVTP